MISVGIVGGTGYTGVELLRLLSNHPDVDVRVVTSRSDEGTPVASVYPSLLGKVNLSFCEPSLDNLAGCDVVFFATPHGIAMEMAKALLDKSVRIIDLSADFRIKDANVWAHWYGQEHTAADLLDSAVYGLPEITRDDLTDAQLIACPGCYPTAVQLALIPLLSQKVINTDGLIADVKSGVSGAGRKAQLNLLMAETGESFKAYAVSGHRHQPEIEQQLSIAAGQSVGLTFIPHLLPMIRGIHATMYCKTNSSEQDIREILSESYADSEFVQVLPSGIYPDTRNVKSSNQCHLAVVKPKKSDHLVLLSTIDNLTKGAAGQAVQCMNLSFGLPESAGLSFAAIYP